MSTAMELSRLHRSNDWSGIAGPALATLAFGAVASFIDLRLAADMLIYLTLAQLWNLLSGYAGLVSVGQQAFVGLGVYAFYFVSVGLGAPTLVAVACGGVAGLLAASIGSIFIFRLKGAYFAIGTWVVAEICRLTVSITPELGGGSGASLPVSVVKALGATRGMRDISFLLIAITLAVVSVVSIVALLRSRYGLALIAIRDSERAAEALGVDAFSIKRSVYIGVAFATALIGALIFLMKLRMTPDAAFSVLDWTAYVLFIVVIGGSGRLEGPFIGTILFFVLRALFAGFGPLYLVILGAVAILVMLFAPAGIWGLIHKQTGWEIFPVRRRKP